MIYNYFGFIFPLRCVACGGYIDENKEDRLNFICETCKLSIVERGDNFCPICGRRYEGITGRSRCSDCIKENKPFERIFYRFVYGGSICDAISAFKYRHDLMVGRGLVLESFDYLKDELEGERFDLIVPVPQYFINYLIRGFSQSAYISTILSRVMKIPIRHNILKKTRYTRSQVGLTREERLKNLKSSFAVKSKELVEGKRILLVDDVYTTGATITILSDLLIRAGSSFVGLFVIARG